MPARSTARCGGGSAWESNPKPLNKRNQATTHANSSFRPSDQEVESALEFLSSARAYPEIRRSFGDSLETGNREPRRARTRKDRRPASKPCTAAVKQVRLPCQSLPRPWPWVYAAQRTRRWPLLARLVLQSGSVLARTRAGIFSLHLDTAAREAAEHSARQRADGTEG